MSSLAISNPTPMERHRFHLLDALRGLAAIVVFFWHVPGPYNLQGKSNGYLAVDFFFCLSGFVVAFSYERRLLENLRFKQFLMARVLRLHPLYLLGLACGLSLYLSSKWPSSYSPRHNLHLIGFAALQGCFIPNLRIWPSEFLFPFNDSSWSLFFEMLANVVYAWAVCRRLAGTVQMLTISALSLLLMGTFAMYKHSISVGPWNHRGLPFAVPRVLLSFCIGVLVMRAYRAVPHPMLSSITNGALTSLTTVLLLLLLLLPVNKSHNTLITLLTVTVGFPLILFAGAVCKINGPFTGVCVTLGNLSYPFYILHLTCIHVLEHLHFGWLLTQHPVVALSLAFMLCAVLSQLAFQYFDLPVRRWLTRKIHGAAVNIQKVTSA